MLETCFFHTKREYFEVLAHSDDVLEMRWAFPAPLSLGFQNFGVKKRSLGLKGLLENRFYLF